MKKFKINNDTDMRTQRSVMRSYRKAAAVCVAFALCVMPAFAAGDPLSIIGNLSDYVFSLIKAVGIIISGWGIVNFAVSLQSHDASQRTQGILSLVAGLIITFAKELLTAIGAI